MPVSDVAPVMMGRRGGNNRARAIGPLSPLYLRHQNIQSFIPGNPLVAGLAPILGLAVFALEIKVFPQQRIENSIFRIDAGPFSQDIGSKPGGIGRREFLTPGVDGPIPGIVSSNSRGSILVILPSFTYTLTGPPVVQLVKTCCFLPSRPPDLVI